MQDAEVYGSARDPEADGPALREARSRPLDPDDPMIEFAYQCLREGSARLGRARPPNGQEPSPDAIHQTRIAVRRIRAALRMFAELLPRAEAESLDAEFRWLARELGEVRDLDVYNEKIADYAEHMPADWRAGLAPYELHLRRERKTARATVVPLFTSDRYRTLMTRFEQFLDGAPSTAQLRRYGSFTIREGVPYYLKRASDRVLRRGAKIRDDSPPEKLHRLRIHCKRLRYELEFFQALNPQILAGAAKAAKRIQDYLGEYQDACTASQRLDTYAKSMQGRRSDTQQLIPLGRLMQSQEARAKALRQGFPKEWARFRRKVRRKWKERLAAQ